MSKTEVIRPGVLMDGKFIPWNPIGKTCPACGGPNPEAGALCGNCAGENNISEDGTMTPAQAMMAKAIRQGFALKKH